MKLAFGHMHYTPNAFWSMSLREWQAAVKGYIDKEYGPQDTPMTKDGLEKMMREYPDGHRSTA